MTDQEQIKKRKWDITEDDDKKEKGEERVKVIDKSEAIKNAIEAAKKIKAKIDNISKEDNVKKEDKDNEDNDKVTENDNTKNISTASNSLTTKSDGSVDNTGVTIESSHAKSFDISSSKYSAFLSSPSFPSLLRDKLQLGPSEHFSAKLLDKDRLILSSSSEDILELAEKELQIVQETGHFRSLKPVPSSKPSLIEKIPLGFDPLPAHISFLRGKLLGPQGSFLKHIQSSTRTRVQLRGKVK